MHKARRSGQFSQISRYARLENTRILAKGIAGLYERCRQADVKWEMNALKKFICETYAASIGPDGRDYLYQNPQADFFEFRLFPPDSDKVNRADGYRMASMLLMYHEITQLEARQDGDAFRGNPASAYETLCNCFQEILSSNMCYIAYRRRDDTRILAASSVHCRKGKLDPTLGTQELGRLLDVIRDRKAAAKRGEVTPDLQELVDGIVLFKPMEAPGGDKRGRENMTGQFLILPMDLYLRETGGGELLYMVFHRISGPDWDISSPELYDRIRDALFLRGRLTDMLGRDLFHLLNSRNEYRGITRNSDASQPLRILHISDIHASGDNWETIRDCVSCLTLDEKSGAPFDFMVITGDVAQGRCSAGDLEENYDHAAEVIRTLAVRIWGQPYKGEDMDDYILRQDWKKRVIIIPGNHDYASMNELETQHDETNRASLSGRPAVKEGSAMAKFTYYINFLRQLLDIDTGDLIDNGLNEFRSYDELQVSFLSLNTSIMANPIRNNKVHLDQSFVKSVANKIASQEHAGNHIVCLCHHGPQYQIDYLSDQYYEAYVCEKITKAFWDYVESQEDDACKKAAAEDMEARWNTLEYHDGSYTAQNIDWQDPQCYERLLENESVQAWLQESGAAQIPKNIVEQIAKKRKKSRLFSDYLLLSDAKRSAAEICVDERYQKTLYSIQRAKKLSENDRNAYNKTFQELQDTCITVTLSGHIHKPDSHSAQNQYAADRFFKEKIRLCSDQPPGEHQLETVYQLHYGICTLPSSAKQATPSPAQYTFMAATFRRERKDGGKAFRQESIQPETVEDH